MKFNGRIIQAAVLGAALFWDVGAWAQSGDALLKKLVEKGVLTQREANEVREDLDRETAQAVEMNHKVKVGSWIEDLTLFGDARLRYELRDGQTGVLSGVNATGGDSLTRERWRYRLRFGAKARFTDDLAMGLRLETSANSRSTNVTFGDDGGPFAKTSDAVSIGQLYLDWKAAEWAALTGGRMPNPLMTSSMIWDGDINPEGAAEKFKWQVNDDVELFAALAQFLYDDVNPENPAGAGPIGADPFLFANQTGVKYKFNKETSLTLAPVVYAYTGGGDTFAAAASPNFVGATAANSVQVRNLLVVEVPLEFKGKMGKLPYKVFSDFAVNTLGGDRARLAGNPAKDDQIYAYQIGLGVGSAKKKGGWEGRVFWEHKELYALDPNLTDSDMFDGRLNMEGVFLNATYAFTDFLTGTITYANGDRADKGLPTVSGGDIGINPLNDYQLLQLDLNWKF